MNKTYVGIALAAGLVLGAAFVPVLKGQAAEASGGLTILEFKPAFDDLMTMLIQPRHNKLYAAGQQKNWELAAFQLNELRQGLRRIGQTIPKYRTYAVDNSVASFFTPAAEKLAAAIKAGDQGQFNAAYGEMTTACNQCHVGLDHPFLVIKTPDASAMSAYVDQDFAPAKK